MGRHTNFKTRSTRGRRRNRFSRPLIVALLLTIAVGGGFYIHFQKIRKTNAAPPVKGPISLMAVEPVAPGCEADGGAAGGTGSVREPCGEGDGDAGDCCAAGAGDRDADQGDGGGGNCAVVANCRAAVTPPAFVRAPVPFQRRLRPLRRRRCVRRRRGQFRLRPRRLQLPPLLPLCPAPQSAGSACVGCGAGGFAAGPGQGEYGRRRSARRPRHPERRALAGGQLNPADAASARHLIATISQTVFFSNTRIKDDPFQTLYQVQGGDRLSRIADRHGVTWELLCRINGLSDPKRLRAGQSIKVPTGPFHCVITKKDYRLDVYLGSPGEAGSLLVTSFMVGLGKDNSTPAGAWIVAQGGKVPRHLLQPARRRGHGP